LCHFLSCRHPRELLFDEFEIVGDGVQVTMPLRRSDAGKLEPSGIATAMKAELGPPMTLGNVVKPELLLIA
jgi:hypothetical protein